MIEEDVDDVAERHGLRVSGRAPADCRCRVVATGVPAQRAMSAVKHEPAPVPRVQNT